MPIVDFIQNDLGALGLEVLEEFVVSSQIHLILPKVTLCSPVA